MPSITPTGPAYPQPPPPGDSSDSNFVNNVVNCIDEVNAMVKNFTINPDGVNLHDLSTQLSQINETIQELSKTKGISQQAVDELRTASQEVSNAQSMVNGWIKTGTKPNEGQVSSFDDQIGQAITNLQTVEFYH